MQLSNLFTNRGRSLVLSCLEILEATHLALVSSEVSHHTAKNCGNQHLADFVIGARKFGCEDVLHELYITFLDGSWSCVATVVNARSGHSACRVMCT